MNITSISLIIATILICVIYLIADQYFRRESFWGGWMPIVYNVQPLKYYGRYGFDAATDDPHMIVNKWAYPINN